MNIRHVDFAFRSNSFIRLTPAKQFSNLTLVILGEIPFTPHLWHLLVYFKYFSHFKDISMQVSDICFTSRRGWQRGGHNPVSRTNFNKIHASRTVLTKFHESRNSTSKLLPYPLLLNKGAKKPYSHAQKEVVVHADSS